MAEGPPDHARAVIIGGGIMGCSVAYHLAGLGWTDIVLLEQNQLTSGTTWHAAGLVGQMRPSYNLSKLASYAIELYPRLEAETGQATGFKQNGAITVAQTEGRFIELKRQVSMATSFGVEAHVIDPGEVDDVASAIIDATDGGADYSFECIGNVEVMGQALACTHKGWGQAIIIGVAGAGEEIHARPFLLVTGRSWRGCAFGGVRGRTELPGYVDRYMAGRIKLDELITATMPLDDINSAFDQMRKGTSARSVITFES